MERTLMIVKPDGVSRALTGLVLHRVEESGLTLLAVKKLRLDRATAERFYAVHKERPFYRSLVEYMTSGPVVVAAVAGEDAVTRYRTLIGATDPAKANPGTIRQLYGESIERNVVHGSDSVENGLIETAFFFSAVEMMAGSADTI
ncbi:MAG: nucleoside-diphosphate kinase [Calditrichaeota bacterium]|nr:nucleoside-diphosphate kinase [Calditrichota bacterium]